MMLETERLVLETWQESDWAEFRPIANDPEVMRYITGGAPWSDDQIRSWVNRQVQCYFDSGFCRWKLAEKPVGDLIGFCGVGFRRDVPDPEIGWWLARPFWGKGLATEAARVALRDVFERVKLDRVISVAMPANIASTGIMKKLGLQFETEFESDGVHLVRYAIDRAQYEALMSAPGRNG